MRRSTLRVAILCATIVAAAVLLRTHATAEGEAPRDILWTEQKRHSYGNEELIIRDFFQDRRDGFFVDVGCAWPVKNSNTYYLESELGWRGIGIDGLPDYAEGWRKKRPRSTFLNFLVSDHSDALERFYKAGVWGLSTTEPDIAQRLTIVGEIEVPSITLDDLLERQGVTRVDFVSIDVEGHQKAVLVGFDVQRWKPDLVCIEDDGLLSIPWFKARGYEPIERYQLRDVVNWYFAPVELARAAQARDTERGRAERKKRDEIFARSKPGAFIEGYLVAPYVLGADGMPVPNPRYRAPAAASTNAPVSPTPAP